LLRLVMVKPANVWIQMHVQSKWPAANVVEQHYLWATYWWRIPFRMKYYNSPKRRFNATTKRQQYWFFRLTLDKPSHQTQLQDCLGYPLHLYCSVCLFRRLAFGHELKGIAWPRTSHLVAPPLQPSCPCCRRSRFSSVLFWDLAVPSAVRDVKIL